MRNLKKNRLIILLFLTIFTTAMIFTKMIPNGYSGPNIPVEDPNNGWHWGVDVGDELYFEMEFIIINDTSKEVTMMFRDIWIYNISSIENVTIDWLGRHEFSLVNATQHYYDPTTMDLTPWSPPSEFALFGYNESDPIHHRIRSGMNGLPFILPLNDTSLQVDILTPILNETLYSPYAESGVFNRFNDYEYNTFDNSFRFINTSHNYFAYGEYYGNNGTLKYSEFSLLANMGSLMVINGTARRVFEYDITDEVEWGVNVGDTAYFDYYDSDSGDYYDIKVDVTNITNEIVPKDFNSFSGMSVPMVYQIVYANLSTWDGNQYLFEEANFPMGAANNFYPQLFTGSNPPPYLLMIMPSNTIREDVEFMWNLDTLRIMGIPLDEVIITENGLFEFSLKNSTSGEQIKSVVNKTTGLFKTFLADIGSDIYYYEQKDMTLVNWGLKPGDVYYYKVNDDNSGDRNIKATIVATYGDFANMTELAESSGGIFTLPSGQPELQFFATIYADFEVWDPMSETWQYDTQELMAMANIYWPIAPHSIGTAYGFPMIVPIGITGADFSTLFDIYSSVFDVINYGSNYVTLLNSTLSRELKLFLDSTTGRLTYLGGWVNQPGGGLSDWEYTSAYPIYNQTLNPGINTFQFHSDFISDIIITVQVNLTTAGAEYFYAYLSENPVVALLPNGTAIAYFDQLIINSSHIYGNITYTITFPSRLDLNEIDLYFFAFNMSGLSQWGEPPPEFYDNIIYDYNTNSITYETPVFPPFSMISAMSYIGPPEEAIPGYNIIFLIISIATITAFIIKKRRN